MITLQCDRVRRERITHSVILTQRERNDLPFLHREKKLPRGCFFCPRFVNRSLQYRDTAVARSFANEVARRKRGALADKIPCKLTGQKYINYTIKY